MSLALIACGLAALALPGLRSAHVWRGSPRWFVLLNGAALTLGIVTVLLGLTVSLGVGLVHLAAGESLLTYDGHLAPGGLLVSVVCGVGLTVIVLRAARFLRRAGQAASAATAETWLGTHTAHQDHEVVVLSTDEVVAYAVGPSRQVVISAGLQHSLDGEAIDFVIDHERAHLRRGHRRYLLLAGLVETAFGVAPTLARSALALRLAIERDADETAAGADPERRRHGIAGLIVLSGAASTEAAEVAAYRLQQLAKPPAGPSRLEAVAGAGLVALAASAVWLAGHTTGDLPALVALLHR